MPSQDKKIKRFAFGEIGSFREPTSKDLDKFYAVKESAPNLVDDDIVPILVSEGWMSRVEPDRSGDIIEPEGWRQGLVDFMKNPAMFLNHDWQLHCGIWTDVEIRPEGLYGYNAIYGTALGCDVSLMIRAGMLRSYSVGFFPTEYEWVKDQDENTYLHSVEQELIECSVVSSPMHILATIEDYSDETDKLISQAKDKQLQLKYFSVPRSLNIGGKRGVSAVDIKTELEPIETRVKDVEVTMSDLAGKQGELSKILGELKDANADGTKSSAELKQVIDNVQKDFLKAKGDFDDAIKSAKQRKTIELPGVNLEGMGIKSILEKHTEREIRGLMPSQSADNVVALQKLHDDVIMIDNILAASSQSNNGNYHRMSHIERVKSLNAFKQFDSFAKAMDSSTSGEGSDWIPTFMSPNMIEMVNLELKVASLFDQISMPSPTFTIDTEGADTIGTLAGQKTSVISALNTVEETPGTGSISFAAKKCRGRYQISTELTEDSAVAIMAYAYKKIVRSLARAEDRAILNGDADSGGTTHFDSGYTLGATDFRLAYTGLRYHSFVSIDGSSAGANAGVDLGTFNEINYKKQRANMGKYGLYPSQLAQIMSIKTYLLHLLIDFEKYQTLDKYGPNAIILSGELARVDNVPQIVSEFIDETQNASGIYDGSVVDRTSVITVNREMWLRGQRRAIEVLSERDILNDVYQLVAYNRHDFKPTETPSSSNVIVNTGFNVPT